jgi:hypothetical protein
MGLLDNTTQANYYSSNDFGNYQFTSLHDIINQFMVVYVGEDKMIPRARITDVQFHAMRSLQELSFDTLKSCKSIEFTVPAALNYTLPIDYVNYTKVSSVDSAGIKHILYPVSKTSNPKRFQEDANGDFLYDINNNLIESGELVVNGSFNGTSDNWELNKGYLGDGDGMVPLSSNPVSYYTSASPTYPPGYPEQGWHFTTGQLGIEGHDLVLNQSFVQHNVPIVQNQDYKVSITTSGMTGGASIKLYIVDDMGYYTSTTAITTNGTHEQTITASETGNQMEAETIMIKQEAAPGTSKIMVNIDNISIKKVDFEETSTTWSNYKSHKPSENNINDYQDYQNDIYWPNEGKRYGLDPQHAQVNGSFYMDCDSGKIYFSSNISGKTVILDYISDSLGTDKEMQVHKFAEEAMYKSIAHAILSTSNYGQALVPRLTKEKFAAIRKAKLRLSNLKLEELTQILRGKSKQIKH